MSVDYSSLSFGVEIEFTRIRRYAAAKVLKEFFDSIIQTQMVWGHEAYEVPDHSGRIWRIIRDASITPERLNLDEVVIAGDDYQCELISPILNYSELPMLQELVRELRLAGARVNDSCGLHVHVGADHFTPNQLRILCNIVYSKQELLKKAVKIKQVRQRYCKNLSDDFIQRLNRIKPKTMTQFQEVWYYGFSDSLTYRFNESRYHILNLHQLLSGRLKTVEFRLFNSTLHAGKVKAYIQLCLLIVSQALHQKKATSRVTISENGNDKYTFRVWLLRMGAISDEFKTMRYHLLKPLKGDSAWRDPSKRNRNRQRSSFFGELFGEHYITQNQESTL